MKGSVAATPRPTGRAWILVMIFLGLPFIAALALADVALWLFFKHVLASCYGIFCLI
ncbi:MAG: hypothetical protein KDH19_19130 [Geminicoccaceae bacterium]|nr:hypothetical protein [Geminicoccaceae bacterium]